MALLGALYCTRGFRPRSLGGGFPWALSALSLSCDFGGLWCLARAGTVWVVCATAWLQWPADQVKVTVWIGASAGNSLHPADDGQALLALAAIDELTRSAVSVARVARRAVGVLVCERVASAAFEQGGVSAF